MTGAMAAAWLLLGRAVTAPVGLAMAFLAVAALAAALAAQISVAVLHNQPWTSRFAAATLILVVGTVGTTSALLMAQTVLASYDFTDVPAGMVVRILMVSGAAALYNFLTMAGLVILPFSLPLIAAFAWVIARRRR